MTVIPPHDRTWLARPRAARLTGEPVIYVLAPRSDAVASPKWKVERAFVVLVIAQAVRVHVTRQFRAIQKMNDHFIADFCANNWPEEFPATPAAASWW